MWGAVMGSADGFEVVVNESGAVIIDGWGNSVMMFPTEQEAYEYLEGIRAESGTDPGCTGEGSCGGGSGEVHEDRMKILNRMLCSMPGSSEWFWDMGQDWRGT